MPIDAPICWKVRPLQIFSTSTSRKDGGSVFKARSSSSSWGALSAGAQNQSGDASSLRARRSLLRAQIDRAAADGGKNEGRIRRFPAAALPRFNERLLKHILGVRFATGLVPGKKQKALRMGLDPGAPGVGNCGLVHRELIGSVTLRSGAVSSFCLCCEI